MPTVFSHAVAGLAITTLVRSPGRLGRLAMVGALCAAAPDLDVVGLWLGVPWGHALGHRGITHSLAFAAALAAVVVLTLFRGPAGRGRRGVLWLALFLATASHGVLDAMTDGGSGVAFFAPFDDARHFSSVAPDPGLADRRQQLLHAAWPRHPPGRAPPDLAAGGRARGGRCAGAAARRA